MKKYSSIYFFILSFFIFLGFFVSGCAEQPRLAAPPSGSKLDVDWSRPHVCTIDIDDSGVRPPNLEFVEGEASVLMIRNNSQNSQQVVAEEFFHNITAWKVVTLIEGPYMYIDCGPVRLSHWPDQLREVSLLNAPPVKIIQTDVRETKALYFVPLRAGVYPLECDMLADVICAVSYTITVRPSRAIQ